MFVLEVENKQIVLTDELFSPQNSVYKSLSSKPESM